MKMCNNFPICSPSLRFHLYFVSQTLAIKCISVPAVYRALSSAVALAVLVFLVFANAMHILCSFIIFACSLESFEDFPKIHLALTGIFRTFFFTISFDILEIKTPLNLENLDLRGGGVYEIPPKSSFGRLAPAPISLANGLPTASTHRLGTPRALYYLLRRSQSLCGRCRGKKISPAAPEPGEILLSVSQESQAFHSVGAHCSPYTNAGGLSPALAARLARLQG